MTITQKLSPAEIDALIDAVAPAEHVSHGPNASSDLERFTKEGTTMMMSTIATMRHQHGPVSS